MSETTPTPAPARRTTAQLIEVIRPVDAIRPAAPLENQLWEWLVNYRTAVSEAEFDAAVDPIEALMAEIVGRLEEHDQMVAHLHRLFRLICELATTNGLGDAVEETRALLARVDPEFGRITAGKGITVVAENKAGRAEARIELERRAEDPAGPQHVPSSVARQPPALVEVLNALREAVLQNTEVVERATAAMAPRVHGQAGVDPGEWGRKYGAGTTGSDARTQPLIHQIGDVELRSIDGIWEWRIPSTRGYRHWQIGASRYRTRDAALAEALNALDHARNAGS